MTQLHAGGKFDQNSYKVSGGLHGVGVSVVNALSTKLDLRIWRNDQEHFMTFAHGDAVGPLEVVGPANGKKGTEVTFLPSSETFTKTEFDFGTLEHRLRELAFLNSGARIILTDKRGVEDVVEELFYDGGLEAFVRYLDRAKHPLIETSDRGAGGERRHHRRGSPCGGTTATTSRFCAFTNNIPQRDGGTHLAGFPCRADPAVTGYAESTG
jgi:DNA gyrase subunit B